MKRLLFVCLGNICRSPLAEGIVRARLDAAGVGGQVRIDSAGTGDWHIGRPPDPRAIAVARRHGIDITGLRARQLVELDFHDFDWLLCADRQNLAMVRRRAPAGAPARTALLLDAAGLGESAEVPDPYYGDEADFERVFALLSDAADGLLQRLRQGA